MRDCRRLAALLLTTALVAGCGSSPSAGFRGSVIEHPFALQQTTLTDTSGAAFDVPGGLDRPVTLVFFGYSHCPDICQTVMANITSALTRLPEEDRARVGLWFVTTDPARDTAPALREYLGRFDPSYVGLTGPLPDLVALAASVKVFVTQTPKLPSGGYEVTHGAAILGVLRDGSAHALWSEGTSSATLAADLHTILHEAVPGVLVEG